MAPGVLNSVQISGRNDLSGHLRVRGFFRGERRILHGDSSFFILIKIIFTNSSQFYFPSR